MHSSRANTIGLRNGNSRRTLPAAADNSNLFASKLLIKEFSSPPASIRLDFLTPSKDAGRYPQSPKAQVPLWQGAWDLIPKIAAHHLRGSSSLTYRVRLFRSGDASQTVRYIAKSSGGLSEGAYLEIRDLKARNVITIALTASGTSACTHMLNQTAQHTLFNAIGDR